MGGWYRSGRSAGPFVPVVTVLESHCSQRLLALCTKKESLIHFYMQRSCQVYVCIITLMLVVREWVYTDLFRGSVIDFGSGGVKDGEKLVVREWVHTDLSRQSVIDLGAVV